LTDAGTATVTTAEMTAGSHGITAIYSGDPNHSSAETAISEQVQRAGSSTLLSSSQNPSTYGDAVTFTATVSSTAGTPTGTVTLTDGSATLATVTLNTAGRGILTTASLGAGSHAIIATYNGDENFIVSRDSISQQTDQAATMTK